MPKLEWNSRLSATAGRFAPGSRRPLWKSDVIIEVATYLREIPDGEMHVRDTILHEMIHYWLWHNRRPYGHGAEFYAKMRATGAKRYNTVPKDRPYKYIYHCPSCRVEVPARRKLNDVACYECCKRFNHGYYKSSFRLTLTKEAPVDYVPHEERIAPLLDLEPPTPINPQEKILPFKNTLNRLAAIREQLRNARIRS